METRLAGGRREIVSDRHRVNNEFGRVFERVARLKFLHASKSFDIVRCKQRRRTRAKLVTHV
jgi:hypothetical protein